MRKIISLLSIAAIFMLAACEQQPEEAIIGKPDLELKSNVMTPEVLWSFGRVSDIEVSPDNQTVLFAITYYDIDENRGNRELYTIPAEGGEMTRLTFSNLSEYNALWKPDGSKIGYISSENGSHQLWEMDPDGSNKKQISSIEGGITGFKYSPDMTRIAYSAEVFLEERDLKELYKGLPRAEGKVINRMMYRHWDTWRETYSHLFLADYDGEQVTNMRDMMQGEPWDFPLKPFWGMEQMTWRPDGKALVYAAKKKDGMAFTLSTNSDLYFYDFELNQTRLLTRNLLGYDLSPVFSPDGSRIAWESMEREGYESDKNRIMVYDFTTKTRTNYSEYFDYDAHGLTWSEDGRSIYYICDWYGSREIWRLDLNGSNHQLTEGIHNYMSVTQAGDRLIAPRQSMSSPTEIFSLPLAAGKEATPITFVNQDLLNQLTMGAVEKRWIETSDNKKMLTWVIYPPNFDPLKTYATLLYCQGGPQGMVSQFWSYRWNFQMMAANNYIIVAPNRRGVPGFGQEWKEQISGDYSGQNIDDLMTAINTMAEEPFVDEELLGAVGASYGGYSVFYLAGAHPDRFSAFVAHDGMFNLESQYLETDEMWFVNWDLGGPYWDTENTVAQRSYRQSPHKLVKNWNTPILIIHGEKDYRISVTQGMMAFNAAKLLNVPAQFLYFPDENHWVLSPQNGILWQRTFFAWLDQWLKPPPGAKR